MVIRAEAAESGRPGLEFQQRRLPAWFQEALENNRLTLQFNMTVIIIST